MKKIMLKKELRALYWFAINIGLICIMYFGYFENNKICENIFVFFFWVSVVFSSVLFGKESRSRIFNYGRSVNIVWSVIVDILVCVVMSGLGKFICATFWVLSALLQHSAYIEDPKKERELVDEKDRI